MQLNTNQYHRPSTPNARPPQEKSTAPLFSPQALTAPLSSALTFKGKAKRNWLPLISSLLFLTGSGLMIHESRSHNNPIPASSYLWLAGSSLGFLGAANDVFRKRKETSSDSDTSDKPDLPK